MSRLWIPLLLVLAVVASLVFYFAPAEEVRSLDSQPTATLETEGAAPLESAESAALTRKVAAPELAPPEAPKAPKAPSKIRYSTPPQDGIRVHVVDASSGDPLPGAEVFLLGDGLDEKADARLEIALAVGRGLPELIREVSLAYLTDQQGQVMLPEQEGEPLLGLRHEGIFNFFALPEGKEITVSLNPPVAFPVVVLDGQGSPVHRAPVSLRVRMPQGFFEFEFAKTNRDGSADLKMYRFYQEMLDMGRAFEAEAAVGLSLLCATPIESWVDPNNPPEEPIVLVQPETGTVEVQVRDGLGNPVEETQLILLTSIRAEEVGLSPSAAEQMASDSPETLIRIGHDGRATFPVALDLHLRANTSSLPDGEQSHADGAGPTAGERHVVLTIRPEGNWPTVSGRILNMEGRVGKKLKFDARVLHRQNGKERSHTKGLFTNETGYFHLTLEDDYQIDSEVTLTIIVYSRTKPMRSVTVDISRFLQPGNHDLGDLVITPPPFLVAGSVLDHDGHPISKASVKIRKWNPEAEGSWDQWTRISHTSTKMQPSGDFKVTGDLEAGRYRAEASAPGHVEQSLEFEIGQTGIEFRLEPSWTVTGSLLVDEGFEDLRFTVALHTPDAALDELEYDDRARIRDEGDFHFRDRTAGDWTLTVLSDWGSIPLHAQPVHLGVGGGTFDLGEIDLRGRLHKFHFDVVDSGGETIAWPWARTLPDQQGIGGGGYRGLDIITTEAVLDLEIGAPGHPSVELRGIVEGQEVVLASGHELQMVFHNGPKLSMGWNLVMRTIPVLEDGSPDPESYSGQMFYLGTFFEGTTEVGHPGRYRLHVSMIDLEEVGRSGAGGMAFRPIEIGVLERMPLFEVKEESGMQVIHVSLNQEDLAAAMAERARQMDE